jgi:hypothetical protein
MLVEAACYSTVTHRLTASSILRSCNARMLSGWMELIRHQIFRMEICRIPSGDHLIGGQYHELYFIYFNCYDTM